MNATLEQIRPETLSLGLSMDEYLRRLLPPEELALKADANDDEFEKDMTIFAEGAENLPAYNGTYSREDIYFDHD
jgi:hypothetical protein